MPEPLNWTTYQVILRNTAQTTPVEDALTDSGVLPTTAITKSRLLREIGWPEARSVLVDDRGKRLIVRADRQTPHVWELKCKPSCWRLYFYVYESSKRIVFLHVVCKKKTEQDPRDAIAARQVFNDLRAGSCAITHFPLEDEGPSEDTGVPTPVGQRRVVSGGRQRT